MHYLIDGHNLIPHVAGLSLADPDDESKLIERLNAFARARKARITVFFDRAPKGMAGTRPCGNLKAVFVPVNSTADQAIMQALAKLKSAARNVTVVTSDRMIQAAARARHASILTSQDFARQMEEAAQTIRPATQTAMSAEELQDWLKLFDQPKSP